MSHEDRSRVPDHLGHVGKGTAMVQMEVCDYHAIQDLREITLANVRKVREFSLVLKAHVHATVEHDVLASHLEKEATSADILASTYN